jgi:hypothetical protein
VPIPTKPPVCNGMIAPRDSWMMPPPYNEMIPPGAPRLLAKEVFSPAVVFGSSRFELPAAGAPEALSGEFDAMRERSLHPSARSPSFAGDALPNLPATF